MLKKLAIIIPVFLFLSLSASAQAADNLYFSGYFAYSRAQAHAANTAGKPLDMESTENFTCALGLGYDASLSPDPLPLRAEAAWVARFKLEAEHSVDTVQLYSIHTIMANCWAMLPQMSGPLQPYWGGGLGAAVAAYEPEKHTDSKRKTGFAPAFALGLGLGLDWKLTEHAVLDLGYRYTRTSNFVFHMTDVQGLSMNVKGALSIHDFLLGLRIRF
jgi:opacity protein-like surface antigen